MPPSDGWSVGVCLSVGLVVTSDVSDCVGWLLDGNGVGDGIPDNRFTVGELVGNVDRRTSIDGIPDIGACTVTSAGSGARAGVDEEAGRSELIVVVGLKECGEIVGD